MSGVKGDGGGKRKPSGDRVPWDSDTSELLLPRRVSPRGGGAGTKTKSKGASARQAGRTSNPLGDASNVRNEEPGGGSSGWNLSRAAVGGGGGGGGGEDDGDDSESDDDEVDTLHPPSKNLHLLGAYNLANNGNRWGWRFDPDRPIYRVWTNLRGWKVHAALFMWTVLLLVAAFACREPHPAARGNTSFAVHVVCMLVCWLVMSEGLVTYRAGELGSASVEMLRNRHRALMSLALFLLLCGFVAILTHKSVKGHSFVPESLHGALGVVIVVVAVAQGAVGFAKYSRFARNQGKSYTWHGNAGQVLYGLLVVTLALGFLRLRGVTLFGVWLFFISFALGTVTVMAAMYQPTSLGGDQHDQVKPTRDVGDHDVELLAIPSPSQTSTP